jgi:hypothetical membrane protein
MNRTRTLPERSGLAAPVVTLGAILVATVLSPSFSWTASALSDLGRPGEPTTWLFDGGLIVGALLALPFVWGLWSNRENGFDAVGTVLLLLSLVSMALVGVFPEGTELHFPMALTFFSALTYALFFLGTGRVVAGVTRFGLAGIWLGIGHVTSWVVWAVGVRLGPGLAIPESVGAATLAVWMVATVARF